MACCADNPRALALLAAGPGCGKSALAVRLTQPDCIRGGKRLLIPHGSFETALASVSETCASQFGQDVDPDGFEYDLLAARTTELLERQNPGSSRRSYFGNKPLPAVVMGSRYLVHQRTSSPSSPQG